MRVQAVDAAHLRVPVLTPSQASLLPQGNVAFCAAPCWLANDAGASYSLTPVLTSSQASLHRWVG